MTAEGHRGQAGGEGQPGAAEGRRIRESRARGLGTTQWVADATTGVRKPETRWV